ncbi:MAG: NUDIX domain-containing protein [Anaerolineae bacterium]|nr:NUDIX domain-containing protein [Anaerolineae bacterium]
MRREYPETPISAVAALIIHERQVLLVLRRNPPSAGQWSVPGGVQELGETLEEALHREIEEETGLTVTNTALLDAGDILLRDEHGRVRFHYVITYFTATPTAHEARAAADARDVRWVTYEEAEVLQVNTRLLALIHRAVTDDHAW